MCPILEATTPQEGECTLLGRTAHERSIPHTLVWNKQLGLPYKINKQSLTVNLF